MAKAQVTAAALHATEQSAFTKPPEKAHGGQNIDVDGICPLVWIACKKPQHVLFESDSQKKDLPAMQLPSLSV